MAILAMLSCTGKMPVARCLCHDHYRHALLHGRTTEERSQQLLLMPATVLDRRLTDASVACQIVRDYPIKSSNLETGSSAMAGSKLTIKLTEDQQTQVNKATGKTITEINIDVAETVALSEQDLDQLSGGRVRRGAW